MENLAADMTSQAAVPVHFGLSVTARTILQQGFCRQFRCWDGGYGARILLLWQLGLDPWAADGKKGSSDVRPFKQEPFHFGGRKPDLAFRKTPLPAVQEDVYSPFRLWRQDEGEKSAPVLAGGELCQKLQLCSAQQSNFHVAWPGDHSDPSSLNDRKRGQIGEQGLGISRRQVVNEGVGLPQGLVWWSSFPPPNLPDSRVQDQNPLVAGDFNAKPDFFPGVTFPGAQENAREFLSAVPFDVQLHCFVWV